jgi:hypothetical protein
MQTARSVFKTLGAVSLFLMLIMPVAMADDHLLLSEAVLTPTSDEFIEIFNPTAAIVDLTDYYLSDDLSYALLPDQVTGPNIVSSDFIVQFPIGASIGACDVVVVAFDGLGFETTFGFKADFEIRGTDPATPDMIATNVGATAGLTNSGENAVLFVWDGASDLVTDVDMTHLGTPSAANAIGNKTGLMVDGPDADMVASTYQPDATTMPQQATDPGFGFSTKRQQKEGIFENQAGGGNGITGHDETSEDIVGTWDTMFTAPTPGVVSPAAFDDFPECQTITVERDTWSNIKSLYRE